MSAPAGPDPALAAMAALMASFGGPPGGPAGESEAAARTAAALTHRPRDWPDELPAKITAWDAATQSASWVERTYDGDGLRIDKFAGYSGDPTFMPAKPIGNGLMPPPAFPVDVRLRRRLMAGTKGVVWEFDWMCACAGHGSGSGSGSGSGTGVLTSCCPGPVPATLTITFTQTAGPACAFDGTTFPIDYDSAADRWTAVNTVTPTLLCSGGAWSLQVVGRIVDCSFGPSGMTIDSCAPLQLSLTGVTCTGADCAGATFTVTVTE